MSTPAEKYVTHWDGKGPMSPQWITRLEGRANQSYHYTREAADQNTAHLNELVKLRAAYAEMAAKIMSLQASEHALQSENAALRHSEESLASTVRGLEFELEKADAALDWLNTHCMSADPIMGRSTYRWTIEHDEPDIRAAIAELRKARA